METVVIALAALACPVGMGLMMFLMAKGMKRSGTEPTAATPSDADELRAEQERLASEIERLERDGASENQGITAS